MTKLANDFDQADHETPKSILVMPITMAHISDLLGLNPLDHAGGKYIKDKAHFESYIGTGLIALELASKGHPHGRAVGYALLGENPVFKKRLCLNNIFVHPDEGKKAEYLQQLVRSCARVCMAHGQDKMDIMVIQGDADAMALCLQNAATKTDTSQPADIYTVSDLSGKFGYGAEKKARELKP